MQIEKQLSVFMVNKPGVLAQVLGEFAHAKINIMAITMMDSVEHGVMRLVTRMTKQTQNVLDRLNMSYSQTDVLCITLSNSPGALAEIAEKLSKNHINISYAYCTAGARGGRTTGVIKVADAKKAMKILKSKSIKKPKSAPAVRRSPATKK